MAYTRLLRAYYRRERGFIDDSEACRLIRAVSKAQKAAVATVLDEFFELCTDGWHNKRADEEIEAYQSQAAHNRVVGNLGGRPKKTTVVSENNQGGSETKPIDNPNQEPLTKNQEPVPENTLTTFAVKPAASPPKKVIDFDLETGVFRGISEEQELRWQSAYPAVPIPPAIEQAAAWLKANPANRKKNNERFLVNWFSRAQDRAGRVAR